ncbi:Fic family protein [Vibrio litoralis]|uniref:Fic family protein n=1 Tax=Vibrio litoralis TaxID=335972 RepID=UPI0003FF9F33|nr:hypothetical protein [Vibrio litoralis]
MCLKITKTNKGNFLSDHNGCSIIESQETLKQATPEANNYESAVLSYCMTPKNREQIQQHLGLKNREYFIKNILKPLIDASKLALTIPDKPTSPKQKFITVQTGQ